MSGLSIDWDDTLSAVPSDQKLSPHETDELICTIRCWTLCFVDACKKKKSQLNLICGNATRWKNLPWGGEGAIPVPVKLCLMKQCNKKK